MKFKKIICWPPLLGGIGAGVTIGILAYITFQSVLAGTNYGLWLAASFGSSVVVVFGYPENEFAQPKNVLLGHLLCALVGIIDFFLVPIKNRVKIVKELITINKLAFVNEISRFPNFISGPIL